MSLVNGTVHVSWCEDAQNSLFRRFGTHCLLIFQVWIGSQCCTLITGKVSALADGSLERTEVINRGAPMAEVLPFFSLGGILMATLTLIQFSPRSVISRPASLYLRHSWFLQDKKRGRKRETAERDRKRWKVLQRHSSFPGSGRLLGESFLFFSFFL